MGDAPLELRKPGGMLVYGLPAASTLFMLRMLWATKRDAVPSDHSYWAMHTPIVLMPLAAAVLAGGIALAWRYERPEWVMGGVLVPALLLDLAGVGEWAPIMPMIAYWALIMTVAGDLRVLCFGLVSCMVLDSQAFAGNAWRQAGWSIWLDVLTRDLLVLFDRLVVQGVAVPVEGVRVVRALAHVQADPHVDVVRGHHRSSRHEGFPGRRGLGGVRTSGAAPTLRRDLRHAPLKRPCSRPGSYQRSSGVPVPGDNTPGSSTTGQESHTEPATRPRPSEPTKHGNGRHEAIRPP